MSARDRKRLHKDEASSYRGDRKLQNQRYRAKHKDKKSAHNKVWYALKKGTLIKPGFCSECGSNEYIQAHHKNYTDPLGVQWLCYKCHNAAHRREA